MRPDEEAQRPDDDDGPHHHPVAKDVLAGMDADQVRHDTEGGQRHDIDFGMAEEPEQVLEQDRAARSEEHTSELQSLMRISYAVFCLKKKTRTNNTTIFNQKNTHTGTTL